MGWDTADGKLIKNVVIKNPSGKRPRGRPRQRWVDRVKQDIRAVDEPQKIRRLRGPGRLEKISCSC